jgi:hypothetical protein
MHTLAQRFATLAAPAVLALAFIGASSRTAFAAQLVRYEVSLGGRMVLETSTSGHNEDPDTMWRYLKRLPLRPVRGYRIRSDQDDALRSTLRGPIVIQVDEGGRAEVSELRLERENENASWKIANVDVNRTFESRHRPFLFVVSIDGKHTLSTGLQARTGPTADDPDNVWHDLRRLNVLPISRYKVAAGEDNPLHATLRGNIRIELEYNRRPWGHVKIADLKLVRTKPNARWRIDPEEIDRTFKNRELPR